MEITELSKSNQALLVAVEKGYIVTNGNVFYKGKQRKLSINTMGYCCFSIRNNEGKLVIVFVHRLVAYFKFGEEIFKKGIHVRHLDSNEKNNFDYNIGIGTASENSFDRPKEVRIKMAIRASSFSKKHDHERIVQLHNAGKSYKQIMQELGISSKGTVSFIIKQSISAKENNTM